MVMVITTQATYAAQFVYGTQHAYPAYGQQPTATVLARQQDGNKTARW
jgi:RNA-binding protein EWS